MLTLCGFFLLGIQASHGQWILVNDTGGTPDPSAALELRSNAHGFLPPRLTDTEMNAISSPATGLLIFNTDSSSFYLYSGSAWRAVTNVSRVFNLNETSGVNVSNNDYIALITKNNTVVYIDTAGKVGIGTTDPKTRLDVDGDIGLAESPANDTTANGITSLASVAASTSGTARALYIMSDGRYDFANASSSSTMPCAAIAMQTGSGSKRIVHYGFVTNSSWSWTPGGFIYMSTTDGVLTQTQPATAGDQVQIVGYATAASTIFFNPSYVIVEVGP